MKDNSKVLVMNMEKINIYLRNYSVLIQISALVHYYNTFVNNFFYL